MATTMLMQVYEVPVYHFQPAVAWLHGNKIHHFTRFGWRGGLIQVMGSQEEHRRFAQLLNELWVVKTTTTFPLSQRKLVEEELKSWAIEYRRRFNPLAFEIETEIDERELNRFLSAIREVTRKPNFFTKLLAKKMPPGPSTKAPNDISSLFD